MVQSSSRTSLRGARKARERLAVVDAEPQKDRDSVRDAGHGKHCEEFVYMFVLLEGFLGLFFCFQP